MDNAFNPREVTMLAQIVDQACVEIGRCDEETKKMLAGRVIRLAEHGERDFNRLLSAIIGGQSKQAAHAEYGELRAAGPDAVQRELTDAG